MNQLDYFAKILDLTYKSLEKKPAKVEEEDYCDRCDKLFPISKLQTYEGSRGDITLCENCEHNYPDEDDIQDEDHNSDR